MRTSCSACFDRSAMLCRTLAIMPPALVPASPRTSSKGLTRWTSAMMSAAPRATSMVARRDTPTSSRTPAGMVRSATSPDGVRTTTAERLPMSARATAETALVCSGSSSKIVARPNAFDKVRIDCPGPATSTAASMPTGTASILETSSMIGILTRKRLATSTASSLARMAPTTPTPRAIASLMPCAAASKSKRRSISTRTSVPATKPGNDSNSTIVPTPSPCPPGVRGSCPIMVDSVMIVSVMVSIARSLMTGVASLSRTTSSSARLIPASPIACRTALATPSTFLTVPLMPVVRVRAPPR